jgi:uncharacterized protein (DUF952 family)
MHETYHLAPRDDWHAVSAKLDRQRWYAAASLATEGFIHCTDGSRELGLTFDRHYGDDRRAFVALLIDLDATGSPWRYDDPGSPYPHIYGPIDRAAIIATFDVRRTRDGRFGGLRPVDPDRHRRDGSTATS